MDPIHDIAWPAIYIGEDQVVFYEYPSVFFDGGGSISPWVGKLIDSTFSEYLLRETKEVFVIFPYTRRDLVPTGQKVSAEYVTEIMRSCLRRKGIPVEEYEKLIANIAADHIVSETVSFALKAEEQYPVGWWMTVEQDASGA